MILLTSTGYVKTHTALNDNTYDKMIVPALVRAQDIDLTECLGECLVLTLKALVEDGVWPPEKEAYRTLLDDYVQPFLAYTTMSNIVLELGQVIGNGGVDVVTDEHRSSLSLDERGQIKEYWKHHADSYRGRMIKFLTKNVMSFPEWRAFCSCDGGSSSDYSGGGIWLGGARGKSVRRYSKRLE